MILQLQTNLEKGLNCAVASMNPERFKRDFEYVTGLKLKLENNDSGKPIYTASLDKSKTNKPI
jgi:hypothetical protein